jgi:hypothetical protein
MRETLLFTRLNLNLTMGLTPVPQPVSCVAPLWRAGAGFF